MQHGVHSLTLSLSSFTLNSSPSQVGFFQCIKKKQHVLPFHVNTVIVSQLGI